MEQPEGKARIIIEGIKPEIDSGRFLTQRVISEFNDWKKSLSSVEFLVVIN